MKGSPMGNGKFHYLTNCVESTAGRIQPMVDRSREITWKTFLRHVGLAELLELFPGYERSGRWGGLPLGQDWSVSFHRSRFCGKPCYYMRHSAIEYIFIR